MSKKNKNILYYVYCALGTKSHQCSKTADRVALIRLFITLQILITNFFIIIGVISNIGYIYYNLNKNNCKINNQKVL